MYDMYAVFYEPVEEAKQVGSRSEAVRKQVGSSKKQQEAARSRRPRNSFSLEV
jgi:hypothetical protein